MSTKHTFTNLLKQLNSDKVDSTIPKWAVFSLCFLTTLIVVSVIKEYLPLLFSSVAMLFLWTQLTKPIAEIEAKALSIDNNQLNLFHRQNRIKKKYSKIKDVFQENENREVA